jgi:hypothetical protein
MRAPELSDMHFTQHFFAQAFHDEASNLIVIPPQL